MIVLGIDPGSRRVGYGFIKQRGSEIAFLSAGTLKVKGHKDAEVLYEIKTGLDRLFKRWRPEALAIEKIYFAKNRKTAISVAEARGVILSTAAERGLKILEYAPNEVKARLTGYGFSDKAAVAKIVKLLLKKPGLKVVDDATDALAVAITACGDLRA